MKKFLVLTCMIACVFGMTACGESVNYTGYQKQKVDDAVVKAQEKIVPTIQAALDNPETAILDEYTEAEVEDYVLTTYGLEVDGNSFMSALDSFEGAYEEIGGYGEITGSEAVVDDKQIVVNLSVTGPNQEANAEVILSNDKFMVLESAALNKKDTMAEAMEKAGLNTVLGMGTVFAVLILISAIISCLGLVSKVQSGEEKKPETKAAPKSETASSIEKTVAQIAVQEEIAATDDLELVAVIAAAIAASQGAVSTDGFVVRSIKRRRA